jgi:SAM-dependent methyltransferase
VKNLTDTNYLLDRQYRDASNLQSRIDLHKRFSTNPVGLPQWFFQQLEVPENARILEIGCGPGGYWPELAANIPAGWRITLSDFSPGMVEEARKRTAGLGRPFTVVQADAQNLPFAAETFDAVVANFMLFHVPDRPRAFSEIRRVLVPGGRLFAITNGRGHMVEFRDLVNRVVPEAARSEDSEFSLENGPHQMSRFFEDVRVVRYPDELIVTETEPLLAVVRSISADLSHEQEQAVRRQIDQEIAAHGAFRIKKDSGMISGTRQQS